jgi:branched-subunit amino acid aminotransferase/4-amino-4-deoxychorismate lyase
VVRHGRLYTPSPADGILAGVVREVVLDVARSSGLVIHEGRLRLRRLERADEAFLSSSVRGVRPLVAVGGSPVGKGRPGPWTRRISEEVGRRRLSVPG